MTPFTVSTAFFKISNKVYAQYLYKKQTQLFEKLHTKSYVSEYFYKDHIPLERVRYCLLYDYLMKKYKTIYNIVILYIFPKIYTHGIGENLRNYVYK